MKIFTGFHAVEERVKSATEKDTKGLKILFSKPGPRVKKILQLAKDAGIPATESNSKELDKYCANLSETAKEHRGIILISQNEKQVSENKIEFDQFLQSKKVNATTENDSSIVVILDCITDPHNVGAIIRSCDQFGVDLVIMPEKNSATDSEIIARSSAGASAWVQTSIVTNLVRAVDQLKDAGYWIFGTDMGGTVADNCKLTGKVAIIMGSEGKGISRLLEEKCDQIVSIPTCGKVDSLNVSVATGILLYEIKRQSLTNYKKGNL